MPGSRSSAFPFHNIVDMTRYLFDRKLAVNDMELTLGPIIIGQRLRLLMVDLETGANRFGIVVGPPFERRAPTTLANALNLGKPEEIVIDSPRNSRT